MVVTYSDKTVGVGATNSWESEASGNGSQEIIGSTENKQVKTKLNFDGWEGDNFAAFDIVPNGNSADLTWSFDGSPIPFMMRGFMIFMKGGMVQSYQNGLSNIATIAEARMKGSYNGYEVKEVSLDEKNFLIKRQEVRSSEVKDFYTRNFGGLFNTIQDQESIKMSGMPCGLFFRMDERDGKIDLAAAMPISEPVSIDGASTFTIKTKNALQVDYYGEYENSIVAHTAIQSFMKDRGLFESVPIIEEYVDDPTTKSSPDEVLTRITYYYSE